MFRLHGYFTQNTLKALYVLEAVGEPFEFIFADLATGIQRSPEFKAMNPVGKVPLLDHDGKYLFESGAICRYVANVSGSGLYPGDPYERAIVDQWLDFYTCHPGRWLTTIFFETVIKPRAGYGEPNADSIAEARKFLGQQMPVVDRQLGKSDWLANDRYSIADLFAFAYVEQVEVIDYSLEDFPNVAAWYKRVGNLDTIAAARARLPA